VLGDLVGQPGRHASAMGFGFIDRKIHTEGGAAGAAGKAGGSWQAGGYKKRVADCACSAPPAQPAGTPAKRRGRFFKTGAVCAHRHLLAVQKSTEVTGERSRRHLHQPGCRPMPRLRLQVASSQGATSSSLSAGRPNLARVSWQP
jgi:hypothetical protein